MLWLGGEEGEENVHRVSTGVPSYCKLSCKMFGAVYMSQHQVEISLALACLCEGQGAAALILKIYSKHLPAGWARCRRTSQKPMITASACRR